MKSNEVAEILKDMVLSCQNHKRGTPRTACLISSFGKVNPEWQLYDMREQALNYAIDLIEKQDTRK